MGDADGVIDLRARPCEWTTPPEDASCGAPSTNAVVIVGAGVAAELALCPAHAAEVAELPNVNVGAGHLLVLKWS